MSDLKIEGFEDPVPVDAAGVSLPVYVSVAGSKPLIVLHELPGMSPSFLRYCREMADEGYKVYMPLIFKSPGTEMSPLHTGLFCLSREFGALFRPRGGETNSRPFTRWLMGLIGHVAEENPDARIGAVGMCLTGGFALAAIAGPGVHAAIACQPSWPALFKVDTLAMSGSERANAHTRAELLPKPCAKGYRFEGDRVSRDAHMRSAEAIFGDAFERHPDLPGKAHSTLTTDSRSEAVFADVLAFLNARL
ncbi:dienelactone hydrolase [Litoreibacter ponti]|uniref:Dienelactone hydrolase n=1 Tax=Litoreibacter ponti TaxID=1510457 RepID=A0A2T6BER3_9RHOB|nr:dienelactone hydrolase family protein [Litoreibacter ponti]PTX54552.1 dienelactone hydrolase [Litoreibacter ponti]